MQPRRRVPSIHFSLPFFGTFTNLWKATISFLMICCLSSAWNKSAQIFMKLDIRASIRKYVEKFIIIIIINIKDWTLWSRSVSRVTTALANVSSVFQLFSFLVVCSDMISKGFSFVVFFASVKTSSVCIHFSCLVCIQSVVHGVRSRLFCGHKGCSLPEVSITSFLPLQFFVSVRLSESNFLTYIEKLTHVEKLCKVN